MRTDLDEHAQIMRTLLCRYMHVWLFEKLLHFISSGLQQWTVNKFASKFQLDKTSASFLHEGQSIRQY